MMDLAEGHRAATRLELRTSGLVTRWRRELAAGRSWREVEAEVLFWSQGRIDALTRLLMEAETPRSGQVLQLRGGGSCDL